MMVQVKNSSGSGGIWHSRNDSGSIMKISNKKSTALLKIFFSKSQKKKKKHPLGIQVSSKSATKTSTMIGDNLSEKQRAASATMEAATTAKRRG